MKNGAVGSNPTAPQKGILYMDIVASEGRGDQAFGDIVGRRANSDGAQIIASQRPKKHAAGEIAVEFLKLLDPAGRHNLVALDPTERSSPIGRTFAPGEWQQIEKFVDERDGKANLYYSVNGPLEGAPHDKLGDHHIGALRAVVADVDLPGRNGDAEIEALRLRVQADLAQVQAPSPTLLIDSGGGMQAVWVFPEKMTLADTETVKCAGRGVRNFLGGDAVFDTSRIMRLPGPVNVPTAKKRAKGRVERRTGIVARGGRSTLASLVSAIPPISAENSDRIDADARIAALQAELRASGALNAYSVGDLSQELIRKFDAAMSADQGLAMLWLGTPPAKDHSGSGYRAALAGRLARLGFTATEYAFLARTWDYAVQAGDDLDKKLSARNLARDWVNVGLPVHPDTISAAYYEKLDPADLAGTSQVSQGPIEAAVQRLNATEAVVTIGGRSLILTEEAGGHGSVVFSRVQDRRTWYANQKIPFEKKSLPVFDVWLEHTKRRQYSKVVFEPGGTPAGSFNLWRGFAVAPDAGASCQLFLDHLRENVCRGDAENFKWLIGWLAHMVQRPAEKPGVAIVLRGGRGVGKTLVGNYVGALFPAHHVTVAQPSQLTGNFNAHLQHALLIQVEEGFWAGDKSAEGALKNLVTSETRMVEPKGVDPFPVRDCARILMTSNEGWVVPAGNDERRWAVFDVGDAKKQDGTYFAPIVAELRAGGAGALLHHLQAIDLSAIDVRTAPSTSGLLEQKLASLSSQPRWLLDCLREGAVDASGVWPAQVSTKGLYSSYQNAIAKDRFARQVVQEQFGRTLNEILSPGKGLQKTRPRAADGPRPWVYLLPDLETCRASFEKWIGQDVHWDA